MRKKTGRPNQRKFSLVPRFLRQRRLPDESDWMILEVDPTPGRSYQRPARSRLVWPIRITAVVALAVSIPMGLKWANEAIFYENEEFVLRQLSVQSDGALSQSELKEIANVSSGMSLMEIDLGLIKERLEKLPVVREAVVSREMPDKLNVAVKERVPVAWLSCPPLGIRPGDMERGFLLDNEGVFFRCLDLTEAVQILPVIEVYRMKDPIEGAEMEIAGTRGALDLISQEGKEPGTEDLLIHAIKLRNEWSLQCLYRSGLSVTFSLQGIDRGLADLAVILQHSSNTQAQLATVDVTLSRNIPVTFAQPIDPSAVSSLVDSLPDGPSTGLDSKALNQEKHLRSILNSG